MSPSEADDLACCFRANATALFGYACVVTRGDRALADDLVQQTFQAAAVAWPFLKSMDGNKLRAWLRATMHNLAVTEFRRNDLARRMQGQIEQRFRGPEPDTERDAIAGYTLEQCWAVIARMPERQHLIALMYWRLGMKHAEIAAALGIAPGTVAAQVHAARKKLLSEVEEHSAFLHDGIGSPMAKPTEGGARV